MTTPKPRSFSLRLRGLFPPSEQFAAGDLDQARDELARVPAPMLIAAACSMCESDVLDADVAAALRVFLLDDRVALLSAKLPTALFAHWAESARSKPEEWPTEVLGRLIDWLSWQSDIGRRLEATTLIATCARHAPDATKAALARLVCDVVPQVRNAALAAAAVDQQPG